MVLKYSVKHYVSLFLIHHTTFIYLKFFFEIMVREKTELSPSITGIYCNLTRYEN
jgi:hypothetical protein